MVSHLGKARSQLPNPAVRVTRVRDVAEEEQAGALQLCYSTQEAPWRSELIIRHFKIWSRGRDQGRNGRPEREKHVVMEGVKRRGIRRVGRREKRAGIKERWRSASPAQEMCTWSSDISTLSGLMQYLLG